MLLALCKTAITPLLTHWSYCSLALIYRWDGPWFLTLDPRSQRHLFSTHSELRAVVTHLSKNGVVPAEQNNTQSTTRETTVLRTHVREAKTQGHSITMTSLWARWRLNSSASRLFTQPFIQAKENMIVSRQWPLCGEFTVDRWIPRTNGQ